MVLKQLTSCRGVSGNEKQVRDTIKGMIAPYADSVTIDKMGNLIAFKKGTTQNAPHVMLAAHMDEVGFIVIGINDDGMLQYETVGGIDPRVVVSKRVLVGEKAVPGVIGAKAIHLQSAEDMARVLEHKNLYIDIGAKDAASAAKLVSPGDFVTFDSAFVEFGEGLLKSRALDDRVGCAAMVQAIKGSYPCDITFAFTTQEETGLRGAQVAAYHVNPDLAIVLEGTTANDLGDVPDHFKVCKVGSGVVISFMDRSSIGNKRIFTALTNLADDKGIGWQTKGMIAGGNDAGTIHTTRGYTPTGVLSVPCRYIHSGSSVASTLDIESQFALLNEFLSSGAAF